MTATALVQLALKTSLGLTVFAVGLNARPGDAFYLLRHRGLLARSLLSMHVIMPVAALVITGVVPVQPAVRLALVALMISPVPGALPDTALRGGGDTAYTISLFTIVSLLSIVVVPASAAAIGAIYGGSMRVPPRAVLEVVGAGVLAPLAAGLLVVRVAPRLAARIAAPLAKGANLVVLVVLIPLLIRVWPVMRELIGDATLAVIAALLAIAMLVGYSLGGPRRDERTVLAMATSSRHPGVAIAILGSTFPTEKLAPAAVLLAVVLGAIVSKVFSSRFSDQTRRSSAS